MEEIKYPIDNTYIHYIKFGSGKRNIVIVSGVSLLGFEGYGAAIEKQYSILKEDYTVYVFDRKKLLKEGATISDLTDDLYHVLIEIGVKNAAFVGMSQGGMITLSMALKYPSMVSKMVIVSSSAKPGKISYKTWNELRSYLKDDDYYNFNMNFYKHVYSDKYLETYKEVLPRVARFGDTNSARRFEILTYMMDNFDVFDRLKEIKCPAFVVSSKNDLVFGVEDSRKLKEELNCDYYEYEEWAHALYDEAPDFLEKVVGFLEK